MADEKLDAKMQMQESSREPELSFGDWFYKTYLDPKRSLDDLRSLKFWKDVCTEFVICTYVLVMVMWVLITCNVVSK